MQITRLPLVVGAGILGLSTISVTKTSPQNIKPPPQQELLERLAKDELIIEELREKLNQNQITMQGFLAAINKLDAQITLDEVQDIVKLVTPSTVTVAGEAVYEEKDPNNPDGPPIIKKVPLSGSGVIVQDENNKKYVLTCAHVTEFLMMKKEGYPNGFLHIKLYNGTDYEAPIQLDAVPVVLSNGTEAVSPPKKHDLALLEIVDKEAAKNLIGIKLRDITKNPLQVGEAVIVVGTPIENRDSVTFGIISHSDRQTLDLNINHNVQTDAPINPGNSGGGLFDIQGRLIGLNTWGYNFIDGIAGSTRVDEIIKVFDEWGIKT